MSSEDTTHEVVDVRDETLADAAKALGLNVSANAPREEILEALRDHSRGIQEQDAEGRVQDALNSAAVTANLSNAQLT